MNIDKILEQHPFLSYGMYAEQEILGIIQDSSALIISIYDISKIKDEESRLRFLELGNLWWWESNRLDPIDIFVKKQFEEFYYCLIHLNQKEFNLIKGHVVSLTDVCYNRKKRKTYISLSGSTHQKKN
jgi:hypothetical protein